MKLKLLILFAAVGLSGCVATMPANNQSVVKNDPSAMCFSNMMTDQTLKPLEPLLGQANNQDSVTLEMRNNKKAPTEEEKLVLSRYYSARSSCFELGRSYRASNFAPHLAQALDRHNTQFLGLIAKLHAGEISYGQFIAAREVIRDEVFAANDAGNRQADALQAQHRAAQAAEMANTMQIIRNLQPPPPRLGVTCTTQRLGTVLNTQCN